MAPLKPVILFVGIIRESLALQALRVLTLQKPDKTYEPVPVIIVGSF